LKPSTIERKYTMTRIDSGDYLLPSNDGKTIWRIRRYDEEFIGRDSITIETRNYWGIWRWLGLTLTAFSGAEVDDWSQWDFCEGLHTRRKDAVNSALNLK
jgi:hypothetical protein